MRVILICVYIYTHTNTHTHACVYIYETHLIKCVSIDEEVADIAPAVYVGVIDFNHIKHCRLRCLACM